MLIKRILNTVFLASTSHAVYAAHSLTEWQDKENIPALSSYCKKEIDESFPNYFKGAKEDLINKSLESILKRLNLGYIDTQNQQRETGFFDALLSRLPTVKDGQVNVYISGGVVRSLLGYLYEDVKNRWLDKSNSQSKPDYLFCTDDEGSLRIKGNLKTSHITNEILQDISEETQPIDRLQALGVMSDFDILLDFEGHVSEQDKINALDIARDFLNSRRDYFNFRSDYSALGKILFPCGDVKLYEKQITSLEGRSAVAQGGSQLDWLAYPILQNGGAKIITPQNHPNIFKDFLEGFNRYHPTTSDSINAPSKQIIRALRPLLELPFLKYDDASWTYINDALQNYFFEYDSATKEQVEKLWRNGRFGSAGNRLHSANVTRIAKKDTLNPDYSVTVLTKLSPHLDEKEYLPQKSFHYRMADKGNLKKDGLLLSMADFLEKYTDNGHVYHGTKAVEHALAMKRNGLLISRGSEHNGFKAQGLAAYGTGFYTFNKKELSDTYAGDDGLVLPLKIFNHENIRIFDLTNHEIKNNLKEKLGVLHDKDLPQRLVTDFDVDIVVVTNQMILIENEKVIQKQYNIEAELEKALYTVHMKRLEESEKRLLTIDADEEISEFITQYIRYLFDLYDFEKKLDLLNKKDVYKTSDALLCKFNEHIGEDDRKDINNLIKLHKAGMAVEAFDLQNIKGASKEDINSLIKLHKAGMTVQASDLQYSKGCSEENINILIKLHKAGMAVQASDLQYIQGYPEKSINSLIKLHKAGMAVQASDLQYIEGNPEKDTNNLIKLHKAGVTVQASDLQYSKDASEKDINNLITLHRAGVAVSAFNLQNILGYSEKDINNLITLHEEGIAVTSMSFAGIFVNASVLEYIKGASKEDINNLIKVRKAGMAVKNYDLEYIKGASEKDINNLITLHKADMKITFHDLEHIEGASKEDINNLITLHEEGMEVKAYDLQDIKGASKEDINNLITLHNAGVKVKVYVLKDIKGASKEDINNLITLHKAGMAVDAYDSQNIKGVSEEDINNLIKLHNANMEVTAYDMKFIKRVSEEDINNLITLHNAGVKVAAHDLKDIKGASEEDINNLIKLHNANMEVTAYDMKFIKRVSEEDINNLITLHNAGVKVAAHDLKDIKGASEEDINNLITLHKAGMAVKTYDLEKVKDVSAEHINNLITLHNANMEVTAYDLQNIEGASKEDINNMIKMNKENVDSISIKAP